MDTESLKDKIEEFMQEAGYHLDDLYDPEEKIDYIDICIADLNATKRHFESEMKIYPFPGKENYQRIMDFKKQYNTKLQDAINEIDKSLDKLYDVQGYVYEELAEIESYESLAADYADFCNDDVY